MTTSISTDYAAGYVDFCRGSAPKLTTDEYLRGFRDGSDNKRILDTQGVRTHNESYPELRGTNRVATVAKIEIQET